MSRLPPRTARAGLTIRHEKHTAGQKSNNNKKNNPNSSTTTINTDNTTNAHAPTSISIPTMTSTTTTSTAILNSFQQIDNHPHCPFCTREFKSLLQYGDEEEEIENGIIGDNIRALYTIQQSFASLTSHNPLGLHATMLDISEIVQEVKRRDEKQINESTPPTTPTNSTPNPLDLVPPSDTLKTESDISSAPQPPMKRMSLYTRTGMKDKISMKTLPLDPTTSPYLETSMSTSSLLQHTVALRPSANNINCHKPQSHISLPLQHANKDSNSALRQIKEKPKPVSTGPCGCFKCLDLFTTIIATGTPYHLLPQLPFDDGNNNHDDNGSSHINPLFTSSSPFATTNTQLNIDIDPANTHSTQDDKSSTDITTIPPTNTSLPTQPHSTQLISPTLTPGQTSWTWFYSQRYALEYLTQIRSNFEVLFETSLGYSLLTNLDYYSIPFINSAVINHNVGSGDVVEGVEQQTDNEANMAKISRAQNQSQKQPLGPAFIPNQKESLEPVFFSDILSPHASSILKSIITRRFSLQRNSHGTQNNSLPKNSLQKSPFFPELEIKDVVDPMYTYFSAHPTLSRLYHILTYLSCGHNYDMGDRLLPQNGLQDVTITSDTSDLVTTPTISPTNKFLVTTRKKSFSVQDQLKKSLTHFIPFTPPPPSILTYHPFFQSPPQYIISNNLNNVNRNSVLFYLSAMWCVIQHNLTITKTKLPYSTILSMLFQEQQQEKGSDGPLFEYQSEKDFQTDEPVGEGLQQSQMQQMQHEYQQHHPPSKQVTTKTDHPNQQLPSTHSSTTILPPLTSMVSSFTPVSNPFHQPYTPYRHDSEKKLLFYNTSNSDNPLSNTYPFQRPNSGINQPQFKLHGVDNNQPQFQQEYSNVQSNVAIDHINRPTASLYTVNLGDLSTANKYDDSLSDGFKPLEYDLYNYNNPYVNSLSQFPTSSSLITVPQHHLTAPLQPQNNTINHKVLVNNHKQDQENDLVTDVRANAKLQNNNVNKNNHHNDHTLHNSSNTLCNDLWYNKASPTPSWTNHPIDIKYLNEVYASNISLLFKHISSSPIATVNSGTQQNQSQPSSFHTHPANNQPNQVGLTVTSPQSRLCSYKDLLIDSQFHHNSHFLGPGRNYNVIGLPGNGIFDGDGITIGLDGHMDGRKRNPFVFYDFQAAYDFVMTYQNANNTTTNDTSNDSQSVDDKKNDKDSNNSYNNTDDKKNHPITTINKSLPLTPSTSSPSKILKSFLQSFKSQFKSLLSALSLPPLQYIFTLETSLTGARRYVSSDIFSFLSRYCSMHFKHRKYCELIQEESPCILYADLEYAMQDYVDIAAKVVLNGSNSSHSLTNHSKNNKNKAYKNTTMGSSSKSGFQKMSKYGRSDGDSESNALVQLGSSSSPSIPSTGVRTPPENSYGALVSYKLYETVAPVVFAELYNVWFEQCSAKPTKNGYFAAKSMEDNPNPGFHSLNTTMSSLYGSDHYKKIPCPILDYHSFQQLIGSSLFDVFSTNTTLGDIFSTLFHGTGNDKSMQDYPNPNSVFVCVVETESSEEKSSLQSYIGQKMGINLSFDQFANIVNIIICSLNTTKPSHQLIATSGNVPVIGISKKRQVGEDIGDLMLFNELGKFLSKNIIITLPKPRNLYSNPIISIRTLLCRIYIQLVLHFPSILLRDDRYVENNAENSDLVKKALQQPPPLHHQHHISPLHNDYNPQQELASSHAMSTRSRKNSKKDTGEKKDKKDVSKSSKSSQNDKKASEATESSPDIEQNYHILSFSPRFSSDTVFDLRCNRKNQKWSRHLTIHLNTVPQVPIMMSDNTISQVPIVMSDKTSYGSMVMPSQTPYGSVIEAVRVNQTQQRHTQCEQVVVTENVQHSHIMVSGQPQQGHAITQPGHVMATNQVQQDHTVASKQIPQGDIIMCDKAPDGDYQQHYYVADASGVAVYVHHENGVQTKKNCNNGNDVINNNDFHFSNNNGVNNNDIHSNIDVVQRQQQQPQQQHGFSMDMINSTLNPHLFQQYPFVDPQQQYVNQQQQCYHHQQPLSYIDHQPPQQPQINHNPTYFHQHPLHPQHQQYQQHPPHQQQHQHYPPQNYQTHHVVNQMDQKESLLCKLPSTLANDPFAPSPPQHLVRHQTTKNPLCNLTPSPFHNPNNLLNIRNNIGLNGANGGSVNTPSVYLQAAFKNCDHAQIFFHSMHSEILSEIHSDRGMTFARDDVGINDPFGNVGTETVAVMSTKQPNVNNGNNKNDNKPKPQTLNDNIYHLLCHKHRSEPLLTPRELKTLFVETSASNSWISFLMNRDGTFRVPSDLDNNEHLTNPLPINHDSDQYLDLSHLVEINNNNNYNGNNYRDNVNQIHHQSTSANQPPTSIQNTSTDQTTIDNQNTDMSANPPPQQQQQPQQQEILNPNPLKDPLPAPSLPPDYTPTLSQFLSFDIESFVPSLSQHSSNQSPGMANAMLPLSPLTASPSAITSALVLLPPTTSSPAGMLNNNINLTPNVGVGHNGGGCSSAAPSTSSAPHLPILTMSPRYITNPLLYQPLDQSHAFICDLGVYTKNRCFRLMFSSKKKETRDTFFKTSWSSCSSLAMYDDLLQRAFKPCFVGGLGEMLGMGGLEGVDTNTLVSVQKNKINNINTNGISSVQNNINNLKNTPTQLPSLFAMLYLRQYLVSSILNLSLPLPTTSKQTEISTARHFGLLMLPTMITFSGALAPIHLEYDRTDTTLYNASIGAISVDLVKDKNGKSLKEKSGSGNFNKIDDPRVNFPPNVPHFDQITSAKLPVTVKSFPNVYNIISLSLDINTTRQLHLGDQNSHDLDGINHENCPNGSKMNAKWSKSDGFTIMTSSIPKITPTMIFTSLQNTAWTVLFNNQRSLFKVVTNGTFGGVGHNSLTQFGRDSSQNAQNAQNSRNGLTIQKLLEIFKNLPPSAQPSPQFSSQSPHVGMSWLGLYDYLRVVRDGVGSVKGACGYQNNIDSNPQYSQQNSQQNSHQNPINTSVQYPQQNSITPNSFSALASNLSKIMKHLYQFRLDISHYTDSNTRVKAIDVHYIGHSNTSNINNNSPFLSSFTHSRSPPKPFPPSSPPRVTIHADDGDEVYVDSGTRYLSLLNVHLINSLIVPEDIAPITPDSSNTLTSTSMASTWDNPSVSKESDVFMSYVPPKWQKILLSLITRAISQYQQTSTPNTDLRDTAISGSVHNLNPHMNQSGVGYHGDSSFFNHFSTVVLTKSTQFPSPVPLLDSLVMIRSYYELMYNIQDRLGALTMPSSGGNGGNESGANITQHALVPKDILTNLDTPINLSAWALELRLCSCAQCSAIVGRNMAGDVDNNLAVTSNSNTENGFVGANTENSSVNANIENGIQNSHNSIAETSNHSKNTSATKNFRADIINNVSGVDVNSSLNDSNLIPQPTIEFDSPPLSSPLVIPRTRTLATMTPTITSTFAPLVITPTVSSFTSSTIRSSSSSSSSSTLHTSPSTSSSRSATDNTKQLNSDLTKRASIYAVQAEKQRLIRQQQQEEEVLEQQQQQQLNQKNGGHQNHQNQSQNTPNDKSNQNNKNNKNDQNTQNNQNANHSSLNRTPTAIMSYTPPTTTPPPTSLFPPHWKLSIVYTIQGGVCFTMNRPHNSYQVKRRVDLTNSTLSSHFSPPLPPPQSPHSLMSTHGLHQPSFSRQQSHIPPQFDLAMGLINHLLDPNQPLPWSPCTTTTTPSYPNGTSSSSSYHNTTSSSSSSYPNNTNSSASYFSPTSTAPSITTTHHNTNLTPHQLNGPINANYNRHNQTWWTVPSCFDHDCVAMAKRVKKTQFSSNNSTNANNSPNSTNNHNNSTNSTKNHNSAVTNSTNNHNPIQTLNQDVKYSLYNTKYVDFM